MTKSANKFEIVPPGEEHLWDSIEECPLPLNELTPSEPMLPEDMAVLKAQLQRQSKPK